MMSGLLLLAALASAEQKPLVESYERAMVTPPPVELALDPFYKKYADAFGVPIVSSEKVPDAALLIARDIVNFMLSKRPDARAVMIERKSRVIVMGKDEMQTDPPGVS